MKYKKSGPISFEDFAFDEADVDASGIQKLITKDIMADLEPMLVGKQLLQEDSKLVGHPGRIRTYRLSAPVSDAQDFNAGDNVPPVTTPQAFRTVDSIPSKFGHSEEVQEDAIDDMDIDAIMETENALAAGMARKADSRIWNEVLGATVVAGELLTVGDGSSKRFNLLQSKILQMTRLQADFGAGLVDVTLGVDYVLDFFRGVVEFNVAPIAVQPIADYVYSTRVNALEATQIRQFQRDDVVNAKTKIRSTSFGKADTCVTHENQMNDLEKDRRFTDASEYGTNDVQLNGEIGKTAGVNFLVSERMYEGIVFVCQKGRRFGRYTWKKKPQVKVEELERRSGDVNIKTWEKSDPKVVNENFGCTVFNTHEFSKAIKSGAI